VAGKLHPSNHKITDFGFVVQNGVTDKRLLSHSD
jgi:hypothetical protein